MVTFPCAYHGGFNQGFNCAEAVNFAPADWLRFGAASTERYRSFRKPSVVSHEQLLMKVSLRSRIQLLAGAPHFLPPLLLAVLAASRQQQPGLLLLVPGSSTHTLIAAGHLVQVAQTDPSPETCFWVRQELQRILQEETEWRCRLWARGELPVPCCDYVMQTPIDRLVSGLPCSPALCTPHW